MDDALAGGHLGAVSVGEVGLELGAFAVEPLGVRGDELAGLAGLAAQLVDARLALVVQGFAVFVLCLVQRDDLGCGLVQALGAVGQFGMRAAALFAPLGRQPHTVHAHPSLADQAQAVAGQQHLAEQRADGRPEFANEAGDVGVARARVAGDGHEQHVLLARTLYLAAGDQAAAVGQQHDLEHDARVVGRGAGDVVAELGVERAQVEFLIDQVTQRELEGAGLDLLFEHHRDEQAVAFDRLVAGHLADLGSLRCEFNAARIARVVSNIPHCSSSSYCTVSTRSMQRLRHCDAERLHGGIDGWL